MQENYDLVIIGAGCVGMAMAHNARKNGKRCLLLEKQSMNNPNRYFSSSFSGRQNRVQYTEKYLTQYVIESNGYWDSLETEAQGHGVTTKFRHTEGGLWFGDKYVTTSEGNIFQSNQLLGELGVERLYMESLIPTQPTFFRNFQFSE